MYIVDNVFNVYFSYLLQKMRLLSTCQVFISWARDAPISNLLSHFMCIGAILKALGLSVLDVVMLILEHLSQLAAITSERTECWKSYCCVSTASMIGCAIVSLLL